MSELTGLRAIVTGGASGIGLATAQLLASRGAEVAVLDLEPSGVPEPLTGLRADVTDDTSIREAVAAAAAKSALQNVPSGYVYSRMEDACIWAEKPGALGAA